MKKNKTINKLAIIAFIIFVITIIPLFIISFYNHPSADDYSYGIYTFNAIKSGGILSLFKAVWSTIFWFYTTWQGTYSAIAIMSLQPAIFGQNFYFLGTFILLLSLIIATGYLFKKILVDNLKLSKSSFILITSLFLFITIQTVPSLVQGFFWWNGACYYTLFYAFLLLELALLLKYLESNKKIIYIFICLFIFVIAGGNFITALEQIILLFFINVYYIFKKKNKKFIPFVLIAIGGLALSAFAPGNAVRASVVTGYSPIKAILLSFVYSFQNIYNWTNVLNLCFIFLIVLLMVPSYKLIKKKFTYPLIATLLSYCIFAALYTPTLYATGNLGDLRLTNIIYYEYFILLIFNIYYWLGWIRNKLYDSKIINEKNNCKDLFQKYSRTFILITSFILLINISVNYENLSSYIVYSDLVTGSAQQYDKEYDNRIKLLEDKNLKNVRVDKFSVLPKSLFYSDISYNKDDWQNEPLAKIYNKESIALTCPY